MITVNIKDGLGNQMFQFATAYATAKRVGTDVACDLRSLTEKKKNPPLNYVVRDFDLDIFNIIPKKPSKLDLLIYFQFNKRYVTRFNLNKLILNKFSPFCILETSRKTNQELLNNKKKNLYIDGYWQTENYFKDYREDILKIFNFRDLKNDKKNIDFLKQINFEKDICLNVRRTDHLNSFELNVINKDYYINGVKFFKDKNENFKIFIFSDDIIWCKNNFKEYSNIFVVDHKYAGKKFKNYMYLMSCFKNFIIPNSTFAWWAAWLSVKKNKIVLVPKKWSGIDSENQIDTIPFEWIKIDN